MAFGFPPKYIAEYDTEIRVKEHVLALTIEAAKKLKWNISSIHDSGFVAYTGMSWSSFSEAVAVTIDNGIVKVKSECTSSQIIDWGKNKKNVENLISTIAATKSEISEIDLIARSLELEQVETLKKNETLNQAPSTSRENVTGFFSIFKPVEGFFITPVLLIINILVFIAMIISGVHLFTPENQSLLDWGANFRPMTLEGQWWRLFTACFIHIGVIHLLMNMYALVYIGLLLEPYLGKTRFLAAYLISGVSASLISLCWHDLTISAGASGAIFGMYGVFIALLTTNLIDKSVRKAFFTSIAVFVVFNIFNGLKPGSGIDNAAHIGGLLSGIIIGYAFVPGLKKSNNSSLTFSVIAALLVVLIVSVFSVSGNLSNDIGKYQTKINEFVAMEEKAMELYNLPAGTANEKILSVIKDTGIYYWNKNIQLLDSFKDLDLPESIKIRNEKLKEYCELRIRNFELIYKAYEENTDQYNEEISKYADSVLRVIDEINEMQQ